MPSGVRAILSAYFPDRSPTWAEVLTGALIGVSVGVDALSSATVSWPAGVAGFLIFTVALGPGANSSLGGQIGQWFRNISVTGRVAVIVLFMLITGVVLRFDAVPDALIADAASGGLLATLLYVIVYIAWAGEVSGWKADRDSGD
ncbi:MAG: hypothetical protein J07HQX50_00278 [Haloquadratum sp. J07HQX50]|nr:MAG: hypothetical protein J07HQX50_00278 [Haloquadratum sp. J07HQX50]